jgi:hypothetical protein
MAKENGETSAKPENDDAAYVYRGALRISGISGEKAWQAKMAAKHQNGENGEKSGYQWHQRRRHGGVRNGKAAAAAAWQSKNQ